MLFLAYRRKKTKDHREDPRTQYTTKNPFSEVEPITEDFKENPTTKYNLEAPKAHRSLNIQTEDSKEDPITQDL